MKTIRGRTTAILAIPVAIALGLGGCAETKLAIHAAKQIQSRSSDQSTAPGTYKVGLPYKIDGKWYYPKVDYDYLELGVASWYGPNFHGRATANGEVFDQNDLTAAHRTLPLPSIVRVTNLENGRSLQLRVNDRGPFARGRIIDVSRRAAQLLGFHNQGTTRVEVRIVADESRQLAMLAGQKDVPSADRIAPPQQPPAIVQVQPLTLPEGRIQPVSARMTAFPGVGTGEPENVGRPSLASIGSGDSSGFQSDGAGSSTGTSSVFVQAGAFLNRESAQRLMKQLERFAAAKVTSTKVGHNRFYRVRLGPIKSVQVADEVLNQVVASGYPKAQVIVEQR